MGSQHGHLRAVATRGAQLLTKTCLLEVLRQVTIMAPLKGDTANPALCLEGNVTKALNPSIPSQA